MPDFNTWPEHRNPTREERTARAPYNFVPLPEKVIPAVQDADELPPHDCYDPERHSGYFDVMLTTRSPLYIRGMMSAEDFQRQNQDQNLSKPEFFYTRDPRQPVISGSSLRGMLHALLEIVSYSKMQWVSEKQLFFRTVDKTAIGKYYNSRMVEELDPIRRDGQWDTQRYRARVEGGFFHVRSNGTYYIKECAVARVETDDLLRLFGLTHRHELYEVDGRALAAGADRNPNQTPKWSYQHREIWADIDGAEKDYFFPRQLRPDGSPRHPNLYLRFQRAWNLATAQAPGKRSGKLVLTGHMNFKHLAFLFAPLEQPRPIEIPNDPHEQDPNKRLVDRFHDDDQLTQWQTKAFPVNRSPAARLQLDGRLRDGDPVFFLRDESGNLVFFGRAQMFRLPYQQRPIDLVPDKLRQATDIDYAEALFGFFRTRQQLEELGINAPQGDKRRAYASRVSVTDAVLQPDQTNIWLAENFNTAITPKILATPKPTAFQMYLTQQQPDEPGNLDHYDTNLLGGKVGIRGHKLYWHKGLGTDQNLTLEQIHNIIKEPAHVPPGDTQHTRFKPLKPGVTFSFRIHFENLSEAELGALCWTLHPRGEAGRRYCHHLGMGKPLGMGAVELHTQLHIIDRSLRYSALFSGNNWQVGDSPAGVGQTLEGGDLTDPDVLARLTQPFEAHLLRELNPHPPCTRLADMRRIAMLLKLLEWPGQGREKTRYMTIQGGSEHRGAIQRDNEYRARPVLPDPTWFDAPALEGKSRPQGSQADPVEEPRTPRLTLDQVEAWRRGKPPLGGKVLEVTAQGTIVQISDEANAPRGFIVGLRMEPGRAVPPRKVIGVHEWQGEWFVKLSS